MQTRKRDRRFRGRHHKPVRRPRTHTLLRGQITTSVAPGCICRLHDLNYHLAAARFLSTLCGQRPLSSFTGRCVAKGSSGRFLPVCSKYSICLKTQHIAGNSSSTVERE